MTVHVLGPRDQAKVKELTGKGIHIINTTSRSKETWTKGLSPFHLGPVVLYSGHVARRMENGWQFSKVYACHIGPDGNPSEAYWEWAKEGWGRTWAERYPMGKGAIPEYSWWMGEKLDYVDARKYIYFPLYANAVKDTPAFRKLRELYKERSVLYLWDFDGYDHLGLGMTLEQVLDDPNRKMGHAFVLAMLLKYYAKNTIS